MTGDDPHDYEDAPDEGPPYADPQEIPPHGLHEALTSLTFFDDTSLRTQAFNLGVVDEFITGLEISMLRDQFAEKPTDMAAGVFLLAQSQMWIFAAYELMRTWRQRASEIVKWSATGGLPLKMKELQKDLGFRHYDRERRAEQLREAMADPALVQRARDDLRSTQMAFGQLEALRVSLAKHEVRGRKNSIAFAPTYGRYNRWCGSLDFEISNDQVIIANLSRRDIADLLRALALPRTVPSDDELAAFEMWISGNTGEIPAGS